MFLFSINQFFFSALTNFLLGDLFRLKRADECLSGLKVPMRPGLNVPKSVFPV